jgi:hypothetical protein
MEERTSQVALDYLLAARLRGTISDDSADHRSRVAAGLTQSWVERPARCVAEHHV